MLRSIPNNVLLRIIWHLSDEDLFSICLVCRRFNRFAFPVFFGRRNIIVDNARIESITLTLPHEHKILSALQLAFFLTSIDSFSCTFLQLTAEFGTLHHDAESVMALFDPSPSPKFSAGCVHITVDIPRFRLDHKRLCEALFVKANHCHQLILMHTGESRRYDRTPTSASLYKKLRNVYQKALNGLKISKKSKKPRSFVPRKLKSGLLKSIITHKVKPKFFLHTLRLGSISDGDLAQTLSELKTVHKLEASSDIKSIVWQKTLSRIANAATELTALTLDAQGIFPNDLLKFLIQLPKLSVLTLRVSDDCYGTHRNRWEASLEGIEKMITKLVLPSLAVLIAPPLYAATITRGKAPKLRTLSVRAQESGQLFSRHTRESFEALNSNLRTHPRPHLQLNLYIYFDGLPVYLSGIQNMAQCLTDYFQSGVGCESLFSRFPAITVVGFSPIPPSNGRDNSTLVLTHWLRLFEGLRHVTFADTKPLESTMDAQRLFPVFRSINSQCPSIETIEFRMKTYDMAHFAPERERTAEALTQTQKFEDLNEDIFYLIFQYLETYEIYPLANVCRTLRNWALPAYLRRRRMADPSTYAEICQQTDSQEPITDVSALILSSHDTIETLSFEVSSNVSLFIVFELLCRFLRLVNKLSRIGRVVLDFGAHQEGYRFAKASETAWTRLILSILNALAEKSQSMAFHGYGIARLIRFPDSFKEDDHTKAERVKWPLKHTLTRLSSDVCAPFFPLVTTWAQRALGTTKSIVDLNIVAYADERLTSLTAALPQVTSLSIVITEQTFNEAVQVLSQLPLLSSLSIKTFNMIHTGIEKSPAPPLLQLRTLVTTVDYLAYFLHAESSLPELETLRIILPPSGLFSKHTRNLLNSLSRPLQILQTRPNFSHFHLTATIPSVDEIGRELKTVVDEWRVIAPLTKELFLLQPTVSARPTVSLNMVETSQNLRGWLSLFSCLERLEFHSKDSGDLLSDLLQHLDVMSVCRSLTSLRVNGTILFGFESEGTTQNTVSLDDFYVTRGDVNA